jgi:hypothetical protein
MSRSNGGIIGKANEPTGLIASGVWSLSTAEKLERTGGWPSRTALALDFDQTTTLDNRITFTRATDGTYVDSTGTLITAGSGVARFDHRLEGGVWVNKGLLIEEQRTNISQRSEEINDAYWTKTNATVTADDVAAPDGVTSADRLVENTTNGNHSFHRDFTSLDVTTQPYSVSMFVKAQQRFRFAVTLTSNAAPNPGGRFVGNLNTDVFSLVAVGTGAKILGFFAKKLINGWYGIGFSVLTGVVANHRITFNIYDDNGASSYAGSTANGIYCWGLQLEAGAFPTSYIKTTSASVTRNADQASMTSTNFSDWYNATEGTVFWQGDVVGLKETSTRLYSISDNTVSEYIQGNFANSVGNGFTWAVFDGAAVQAVLNTPDPPVTTSANTTYKHAAAYKVNDFAASRDGGAVATDTSGTIPTVDRVYFGLESDGTTTASLNGHIAKFYYWNTRRFNSFLQSITG